MVRTQIQLTEKQAEVVKRLAKARHLSISELIRQAVDTIIKSGVGHDPEDKRRRAIEIVGRFRSGKRDISTKHDEYLAEAMNR